MLWTFVFRIVFLIKMNLAIDGKVIKKENWDNGKLIYKKAYK